ncbi:MAG: hypothetical protein HQK87_05210 [Nitrospinae bacterium]|nr:hypothetical protein [Nitrospinota bacterium]
MDLVWIVIILFAAGFLGSRFAFAKERLPALLRDMFLTGWEYIFIGMVLGPLGFDLIDQGRMEQLSPLLALGLAWAGLIFGMQMRVADLKKVDRGLLKLTLFQMGATFAALFGLTLVMGMMGRSFTLSELFAGAGVVAAAGAISSPTTLSMMASFYPRTSAPLFRRLLTVATLDVGPALVAVGLVFCLFPAGQGGTFDPARGATLLFFSVLIALAMAGIFRYFGRKRLKPEEELTVLLGFLAFLSGVALFLKLSPLFLALMVGVTLANTLERDDPVFTTLFATEKPFYLILLILTGLLWSPSGPLAFFMALAVALARFWAKGTSVRIGTRLFRPEGGLPDDAGLGLMAQGALALAIGVNYLIVYPGEASRLVFGVIALMVILNEVVAPFLIRRVADREAAGRKGGEG